MSHRLQQVSALIQKDVANIIRRELELPAGVIVGVTKVVVGPDLKFARILVSIMPETEAEPVLKFLNKNRLTVQQALAGQLTMKFSPKISFSLDQTEMRAQYLESLLDKIQKPETEV